MLKPLESHPDDWSLLQRIENQASELLQALPSGGALRRRAERRLQEALGVIPQPHGGTQPRPQSKGAVVHRPKAPAGVPGKGATHSPVTSPRAVSGQEHANSEEPRSTAIDRAEFRALRLFACSPVCRDPLAVLVVDNDLYRRAQHCLVQVHHRLNLPISSSQDDPLPKSVLALCPQLEPHLAQLLEQLCSLDPDVRERLFQQPEGEMLAVLDVLEPVG